MASFGEIEVEGLKQFQRAARRAADASLPKRLGQANKKVGQKFIAEWLHPSPTSPAVGEGRGASVRPSASKREVLLRVGGAHRSGRTPQMQWGVRLGRRVDQPAPPRPYIRESVERHRDEIEQFWLDAVAEAVSPAFYETDM